MDFTLTEQQVDIRKRARDLARKFDDSYWRRCDDEHEFPTDFYNAFADAGWLAIAIPEEYGGAGSGIVEASLLLQEVAASGAGMSGSTALHITILGLQPLIKHGSDELKRRILPEAAAGRLHMAFSVTEPDAGSDTAAITTRAVLEGDHYVVRGKKVWTSGAKRASKALVLVRTTPLKDVVRRTEGMSLLMCDLDPLYVTVRPIDKLGRNAVDSDEIFFNDLPVRADNLVGEEGKGFYHLLDGMNPERIVIASEALGTGEVALRRAVEYAKRRIVFNRPIGQNQAIQFPLAETYAKLQAAELLIRRAAWLYDHGLPCGPEANIAKYLAADWAFESTDRAIQVFGGYGYAKECDVERYWREARLMRLGPITQEMILNFLGHKVLGLPRAY
jgi:acyl-CoA dehydrogenase